jgi:integrase
MARKTKKLLDMNLRAAVERAIDTGEQGRWNDGGGLVFIVTAAGKARALHRYEWQGIWKSRWYPGEYPRQLSLANARAIHANDIDLLENNIDPSEDVAAQELTPTLEAYARKHFRLLACAFERDFDPIERSQWFTDVTVRMGRVAKMDIDKIRLTDVEGALKHYWVDHVPRPTAARIASRVAAVLRHRHARTRPDEQWMNPADWKTLKDRLGNHRHFAEHHASLEFEQVPALIKLLRTDKAMSARCLEWVILTGCRAAEATGAKWGEIDLGTRTWTIPTSRLKTERSKGPRGKAFVVPLSLAMVEVLQRVRENRGDLATDDLIFPGREVTIRDGRRYKTQSLRRTLARHWPDISTHGFRSTLVAWGVAIPHRKRQPFELVVMDRVIGHNITPKSGQDEAGSKISQAMGAYAHKAGRDLYLARRKVVMREWSAFIRNGLAPELPPVVAATPENDNVVHLHQQAKVAA